MPAVSWQERLCVMGKIALNYIYLSEKHAGGKDQAGLNLLKGFYENGQSGQFFAICFSYSEKILRELAPDMEIISIPGGRASNELTRMAKICWTNTFRIPQILRQKKASAVYHLNCNNGLRKMPVPSAAVPYDIKAVAHRVLANVKIPFYKYWLYRILYRMDFSHADRIVAISQVDQKEIGTFYPQYRKKIHKIYIPVDCPLPEGEAAEKKNIHALNLQFHHKNIITLVRAFEKIQGQTDQDLILMGRVPERVQYLKEYVKQHQLEKRVHFTGFLPEEQVQQQMHSSRLYVNPTLYEGFGMTAVEAMIQRVPTLLSGIPTNREVTGGLCRYYEPPEDVDALAQALLDCLQNPPAAEELQKASQYLYERYHYRRISQECGEFLRQLGEEKRES